MNRELSRNHLKDLLITLQHWHAWEAQATECQLQIWQRTPSGILYSIVNAVPQLPGGREPTGGKAPAAKHGCRITCNESGPSYRWFTRRPQRKWSPSQTRGPTTVPDTLKHYCVCGSGPASLLTIKLAIIPHKQHKR